MTPKKSKPQTGARLSTQPGNQPGSRRTAPTAFERAWASPRERSEPPPTVSGRWLAMALGISVAGAALCAWGALCLLFWQGAWQLLYHPAATVTRTPASVGIRFDAVGFATTEAGVPRLAGWWIPAAPDAGRLTVLYLHGRDGNLSDTVDSLAALHQAGVNVLAFDYRGYGQSQFARPSEAHWREDAAWALDYLTATRHIAPGAITLEGDGLGANLALEVAAAHPELAGAIVQSPMQTPADAIFNDGRAHLVPAHLLVRDRFDMNAPSASLRIPSLWFAVSGQQQGSSAYDKVPARKMRVWLPQGAVERRDFSESLMRWLTELGRSSAFQNGPVDR